MYAHMLLVFFLTDSIHQKEKKRKSERINTDMSSLAQRYLQVSLFLIYEQQLLLLFWKELIAYSFLFWLTIKIWM
jgi:hypothetical protein